MWSNYVIDKSVCTGEVSTSSNHLHIEKYKFYSFDFIVCNFSTKQLMVPYLFSDNFLNKFSIYSVLQCLFVFPFFLQFSHQLLLIGGQVNEAFNVLENVCQKSEMALPFR